MVSAVEKTIDGLDGNGLLKTYALSMEDKMAAVERLGALGTMGKKVGNTSPLVHTLWRLFSGIVSWESCSLVVIEAISEFRRVIMP